MFDRRGPVRCERLLSHSLFKVPGVNAAGGNIRFFSTGYTLFQSQHEGLLTERLEIGPAPALADIRQPADIHTGVQREVPHVDLEDLFALLFFGQLEFHDVIKAA